jgi:Tfp pilus assembly protein PilV
MVKLIRTSIPGNILEPLIALIIVLVALTASFSIVLQARQNMNVAQISRANVLASQLLNEALATGEFPDEETIVDGLLIEKEISWFDEKNGLLHVKVSVSDNRNRVLSSRQRIIIGGTDDKH